MPLKPTPYMLENPMYQAPPPEERESYGEVHCFLDRKERPGNSRKQKRPKFEEEDI